jgi:hypothetical protein
MVCSTTRDVTLRVRFYQAWTELPGAYDDLFAQAGARDFGLSRPWFELLAATILAPDDRLCLVGAETLGGTPRALLVGIERRGRWAGRRFRSLANFYTMAWSPLLAQAMSPEPALDCLAEAFAAARPPFAEVHLEPLAVETGTALAAALDSAGFRTARYHRFGNRFEPVAGLSAATCLAARPGHLRGTLKRKRGALRRAGRLGLRIVRSAGDLESAIADYGQLQAASWPGTCVSAF